MAQVITYAKNEIPFLTNAAGGIQVTAQVPELTKPLKPTNDDLFGVQLDLQGSPSLGVGGSTSVTLGLTAKTGLALGAFWRTSSPGRLNRLIPFGLDDYFTPGTKDKVLLALTAGVVGSADLSAKAAYSALTVSASLEAGADASFGYARSLPAGTPAQQLLADFVGGVRLPANVDAQNLKPDEVIFLEYGGYLNLGASVGVGYEIKGSQGIRINDLNLVERYAFSVLGKVGVEAKVAGRFRVDVRNSPSRPGWVRVAVRKSHSGGLSFAADVSVAVKLESEGLPASADEFLGALLGLKAKNWISLFQDVRKYSDFQTLEKELDSLAKEFIHQFTGKAFAELSEKTKLDEAVDLIAKVVDSYNHVEADAVTLFDRYYDPIRDRLDGALKQAIDEILAATSWDELKKHLGAGDAWEVLQQLTGGDPLAWILGQITVPGQPPPSLQELQNRAAKVLALIQDDAHAEIRRLIALAKKQFPLDGFVKELDGISWQGLQKLADDKLTGFVERLIGKALKGLGNTELKTIADQLNNALNAIETAKNDLYEKIKTTLNGSLGFELHAGYSRATEGDALFTCEIDLGRPEGLSLMRSAGHGDLRPVLAAVSTPWVAEPEGVFTKKLSRSGKLSVNVTAWHLGWHYQSLGTVLVEFEQRLQADERGQLTVYTTFDMSSERDRKRNGERVFTSLLVRLIGESGGVVTPDPASIGYLIDTIEHMSARYRFLIEDDRTTEKELQEYLGFADDFGLVDFEETALRALEPILPREPDGTFGAVSVSYDVRFTEAGLKSVFFGPFDEAYVRQSIRLVVLGNYVNREVLKARAWAYWTPGVYTIWKSSPPTFENTQMGPRVFQPIKASPLRSLEAPASVTLDAPNRFHLGRLYYVEDRLVEALRALSTILQSGQKLTPGELQKRLFSLDVALDRLQGVAEGSNPLFALLDLLIKRHPAAGSREASLTLTSIVDGRKTTRMLLA